MTYEPASLGNGELVGHHLEPRMEDIKPFMMVRKWATDADGLLTQNAIGIGEKGWKPCQAAGFPENTVHVETDTEWKLIEESGDDSLLDILDQTHKRAVTVVDLTQSEPWVIASESGEFIPAVCEPGIIPTTDTLEKLDGTSSDVQNEASAQRQTAVESKWSFLNIKQEQEEQSVDDPIDCTADSLWNIVSGGVEEGNVEGDINNEDNGDKYMEPEEEELQERSHFLKMTTDSELLMECEDEDGQVFVKAETAQTTRRRGPGRPRGVASTKKKPVKYKCKRNYCLFCKKPFTKISKHLEFAHCGEIEVVLALSLPLHSVERKAKLQALLNKGNFVHNMEVLKTGKGTVISKRVVPNPAKRAKTRYEVCSGCHAFLKEGSLAKHLLTCLANPVKQKSDLDRSMKVHPSATERGCPASATDENLTECTPGPRTSARIQQKRLLKELEKKTKGHIEQSEIEMPMFMECEDVDSDDSTEVVFEDDSADEDYKPQANPDSKAANKCYSEESSDEYSTCSENVMEDAEDSQGIKVFPHQDKKRWGKKHCCLYCKKMFPKLPRHFKDSHGDEEAVVAALSLPLHSAKRKAKLVELLRKGDYNHNLEVLNSGKGTLIPIRRPSKCLSGEDYFHCRACQLVVHKSHIYRCPMMKDDLDSAVNEKDFYPNYPKRKRRPNSTETEIKRSNKLVIANATEGKYSKRHACLFCGFLSIKVSQHMERKHSSEPKVTAALSFPKGSVQRRQALHDILCEGDYKHNAKVLESNKGKLIPKRRAKNIETAENFTSCPKCMAFIKKTGLAKHRLRCQKEDQEHLKEELKQHPKIKISAVDRIHQKYKKKGRPKARRDRPLCDRCGNHCEEGECMILHQQSGRKEPQKIQVASIQSNYQYRRKPCPFCKKFVTKLSTHLVNIHSDEPEVSKAQSFPKFSTERRLTFAKLHRKGNYLHNTKVLKTGRGALIPQRRSSKATTADKFVPCLGCGAFMKKTAIAKHARLCPSAEDIPLIKGRGKSRRQFYSCAHLPISEKVSDALRDVLDSFKTSEVNTLIRTDDLIVMYGNDIVEGLSAPVNNSHVGSLLRLLGRFLIEARKQSSGIQSFIDCIDPVYFPDLVNVSKVLGLYDADTKKYQSPSVTLKIGTALRKCATIVCNLAKETTDEALGVKASSFLSLCQTNWAIEVSSQALEGRRQKHKEAVYPKKLDLTDDIKAVCFHLQKRAFVLKESLQKCANVATWRELAKVTELQIVLFNHCRSISLSNLIHKYQQSTQCSDSVSCEAEEHLSAFEKVLVTKVNVIDQADQAQPIILAASHQSQLDLLYENKDAVGMPQENQGSSGLLPNIPLVDTSEALLRVFTEAGIQDGESLLKSEMNRQVAVVSQILSLSEKELGAVFTYLEHEVAHAKEFIKGREDTYQLAKIAKAVLKKEDGERKMEEADQNHDKPSEEINLDKNETVECGAVIEVEASTSDRETVECGAVIEEEASTSDRETVECGTAIEEEARTSDRASRRRGMTIKTPWTLEEKMAIQRQFHHCLWNKIVPGREDCLDAQDQEPLLAKRPWAQVKHCVESMISTKIWCLDDREYKKNYMVMCEDSEEEGGSVVSTKRSSSPDWAPERVPHEPEQKVSTAKRKSRIILEKPHEIGKKSSWSKDEKEAIKRQLGKYLMRGIIPGKDDCLMAKEEEPILALRPWAQIKYCVKNMLASKSVMAELKRKREVQQDGKGQAKPKHSAPCKEASSIPRKRQESGRTPWSWDEREAVERQLGKHLRNGTIPGKDDCLRAKENEPILALRPWDQIKYCVKNMLASPKSHW